MPASKELVKDQRPEVYILQHPAILPPRTKEPQFFNGKKAATVEGTMQRIATYAKMFPRRSSSSSLSLSKDRQGDKKEEDACLEQVDLMPNGTIQSIPPLCRRRDPSVLRIIRKMSSGGGSCKWPLLKRQIRTNHSLM